MNFEDLKDPGFQEKLKAAKTPAELVALAKEEGIELSDDQLDQIAGGSWGSSGSNEKYPTTCSACGHKLSWPKSEPDPTECPNCGHPFLS